MTFREYLHERGVEPGARLFKYGYEDFDGEKLYLDGRYTLEELHLAVAFMEYQARERILPNCAAMTIPPPRGVG